MRTTITLGSNTRTYQIHLAMVVERMGFIVVLFLAAYLRLSGLSNYPGWYSDEGTLVDIAQHLLHGHWQYMAINQSTLIAARPPLFSMLLSMVFRWFEPGIVSLRMLTGFLGILSVGLIYILVRHMEEKGSNWLSLLSAFILAIYPQSIINSRIGFSYNLLAVLALMAFLGLIYFYESQKYAWLVLSSLAIGIGILSDLMMLAFVLPGLIIISLKSWRGAIFALLLIAFPGAIYIVWMLTHAPAAFIYDTEYIFSRLGDISGLAQIPALFLNYFALITRDSWALLGIIGMFLVRPLHWRVSLLMFVFFPLISLGRTTWYGAGLGIYYLTALLPFFALGLSIMLWISVPKILRIVKHDLISLFHQWGWRYDRRSWLQIRMVALTSSLTLFMVVLSPLFVMTIIDVFTSGGLSPVFDPLMIDAEDAQQVQKIINAQVHSSDLVVASPAIAWGINANTADFQQTLAAQGIKTKSLPDDIPPDRFAFNPSYQIARYVVIDNIWRNWAAVSMPEVKAMMDEVETWPLSFSVGEIDVYLNPRR